MTKTKFVKSVLLALVVVVAPIAATVYFCPLVNNLRMSVTGWGWALLIGFFVASLFIKDYLSGLCCRFISEQNKPLRAGIAESFKWVFYALAFLATCLVAPSAASFSSAAGLITVTTVVAVCTGVDEYLNKRLGLF